MQVGSSISDWMYGISMKGFTSETRLLFCLLGRNSEPSFSLLLPLSFSGRYLLVDLINTDKLTNF